MQHSKPLENDPSKDQGGKDPGEEVANGSVLALALREGGGAEGVDLFHSGVIGCGDVVGLCSGLDSRDGCVNSFDGAIILNLTLEFFQGFNCHVWFIP